MRERRESFCVAYVCHVTVQECGVTIKRSPVCICTNSETDDTINYCSSREYLIGFFTLICRVPPSIGIDTVLPVKHRETCK